MTDIRYVRYRNCYGQDLYFDNRKFFAEEIHIGGTPAKYDSLSLFDSPGIITDNYSYEPMPIRFRFALKDKSSTRADRDRAVNIFTPTAPGIITIYTQDDEYSIDAHLTAVPDFTRANSHVWRWEASFIADFPFFRKGRIKQRYEAVPDAATKIVNVYSSSPVPVHPEITVPPHTVFIDCGFFINSGDWATLNTSDYSLYDENGNDISNCLSLSSGYTNVDDIYLYPGNTSLKINTNGRKCIIEWWELRGGII